MLVERTNLKKIGKLFMSKFVGTGLSSYKKKEFTGPQFHKGWETLVYSIAHETVRKKRSLLSF